MDIYELWSDQNYYIIKTSTYLSVFIYLFTCAYLWETQFQSSVSKLLTSSVYIYYLTYSSTYCSPKFIDVWMS